MLKNPYSSLLSAERRAFWIAVLMTGLFGLFQTILIDTFITAPNLQYRIVNIAPSFLAIISFVSAIAIFFGRARFGATFFQLGIITTLILIVSQADGFGFPAAFIILAVTLYIPVPILTGQQSSASFWVGVAGAVGTIVIDTFWEGSRVPALSQDTLVAGILSIVLSLVLLFTTIRQFGSFPIRTKLLILAMGTGLVSILAVAIFSTITTQQALTTLTRESLASAAQQTIDEVDIYIDYSRNQLEAEALFPEIVAFLKRSPQEQSRTRSEMIKLFNNLSQRDPKNITSYALLNLDGIVIVDTFVSDIESDKSNDDYFLNPVRTGRSYVSPVQFYTTSSLPAFFISVPVKENDVTIGVLRVRYATTFLNDIMRKNNGTSGDGSYAILLDEFNIVIAHGTNSSWAFRTLTQPTPETYAVLQSQRRIQKELPLEEISLELPDFAEKVRIFSPSAPYFTSNDEAWGSPVEVGMAKSTTTSFFKVAFIQSQSIALAAVTTQQRFIVAVTLITGLIILFASTYVLGTITRPLADLAAVAEDISAGNLRARANYEVIDEIGVLANSLNRMTNRLRETLSNLEGRVAERTADLDMARLISERRAQELQSISDLSRTISTEQRLEILLPLISRLVSERFDFYHVGIFFLDGTGRYAYLQASNSEGGQAMLARGHRLDVGTGVVGTAAKTGKSRIALDVGSDAAFFNNPDLPKTRSEMALPLNVRNKTIGVLDVQSEKPGAFTEADANTLGILADQVAIAIENARLFSQSEQARDEAEALYSQVLRKEWGAFIQQETKIGYRQSPSGGRALSDLIETDEIRQVLAEGKVVMVEGKGSKSNPVIALPVKLRGETIGVLNIKAPERNRKWNADEINLVQAISDRLAIALDNARLLQESQRRAAKEAKIGEVSAKISASINMRNVLQTAVEELGRALPGSEVVIQFESDDEGKTHKNRQES